MNKIRVIAAIVDVNYLTLYKEDGETVLIKQGDRRLAPTLAIVKPIIAAGGVAEVDMDSLFAAEPNHFSEYEKRSGGLVSFFKVAKQAVKKFFSFDDEPAQGVAPEVIGDVEYDEHGVPHVGGLEEKPKAKPTLDEAIDEVLAHAVPATSYSFALDETEQNTHEIIAVVDTGETKAVIPAADNLQSQLKNANATNSVGMDALLKRLAAMPKSRAHSVEDLLKFLRRADLPLTDSGDIVIYKILNENKVNGRGDYVDCHSGKVGQGEGFIVEMDESLVDPNRRAECSNGLHVARRGYLGCFTGSHCLLGVIRPEDVIAVPHGDANKMRVCRYELIYVLNKDDYRTIKADQPLAVESEAAKKIANIIAGLYPPAHTRVQIGGPRGTNLVYTKLGERPVKEQVAEAAPVASIDIVDPEAPAPAPAVDPKAVAKEVATTKAALEKPAKAKPAKKVEPAKPAAPAEDTPRARIAALLAQGLTPETANQIAAIKKLAKKGYHKLGVDAATEEKIKSLLQ